MADIFDTISDVPVSVPSEEHPVSTGYTPTKRTPELRAEPTTDRRPVDSSAVGDVFDQVTDTPVEPDLGYPISTEYTQPESIYRDRLTPKPNMWDAFASFYDSPYDESAKTVDAMIAKDLLREKTGMNISLATAYEWKDDLAKFNDLDPDQREKRQKYLAAIKTYNDTGIEGGWYKAIWTKGVKTLPFQLMASAGGLLQLMEENDYEYSKGFTSQGLARAFGILKPLSGDEQTAVINATLDKIEEKDVSTSTIGGLVFAKGKELQDEDNVVFRPGSWKELVSNSTASVANYLAWFSLAAITKQPSLAIAGFTAQETGDRYPGLRAGGFDVATSTLAALGHGAAEGLPEALPLSIYLKTNMPLVKKAVSALYTETLTEEATTTMQSAIDKVTLAPGMTARDYLDRVVETAQVTLLTTVGITGASHTMNKMIARDLPIPLKEPFNAAVKETLDNNGTPQEAVVNGLEAVKATPEGAAHIDTVMASFNEEAARIASEEPSAPEADVITEPISPEEEALTIPEDPYDDAILSLMAEGVDLETMTDEEIEARAGVYEQGPISQAKYIQTAEDLATQGYDNTEIEYLLRVQEDRLAGFSDTGSWTKERIIKESATATRLQGDSPITIYRAVPKGASINEGDYVFLSERDAVNFVEEYGRKRGQPSIVTIQALSRDLIIPDSRSSNEAIYAPTSATDMPLAGERFKQEAAPTEGTPTLAPEDIIAPWDVIEPIPADPSVRSIVDSVAAQLRATEGYTQEDAAVHAQVFGEAFRVMAKRAGINPEDLYRQYNIKIGKGVDTSASEKAKKRKRTTLVDLVRSAGGISAKKESLKGEIEQFTVKGGYNLINNKTGKTLDQLTEAAQQYGFFDERPSIDEFLEALSSDIRFQRTGEGKPAYSSADLEAYTDEDLDIQYKEYLEAEAVRGGTRTVLTEEEYFQKKGGPARGRIAFGLEGINIELLQNADKSTFLHELGHFYLKMLGDLATMEGAKKDIVADYATIRDWLGAKKGEAITVKQHEKFARGFEAYLMEGKAPSLQLKAAFEQFASWLTEIYKTLTALNVKLTPEVRGVLDRMMAERSDIKAKAEGIVQTSEAISKAEGLKSVLPRKAVKGQIARTTGMKKVVQMIGEDEALSAAWKKAEQNSKIAFRAGKKEAVEAAKAEMREIVRRARIKEVEREKMVRDIKSLKKLKDKSKGKIAVEYQEAIRQILAGIDFKKPTDDTILRLTALHDYILQNGVPLGISQAELNQLGRLSQVAVRDLSADALSKLAATVKKLYDLGKLKAELLSKKEGRERQKALTDLMASTRSLDPVLSGKEEPTRGDIVKAGAAALKVDITHTFRVADNIDGVKDYNGVNAAMVKEEMQAEISAKNETNRRSRSLVEKIRALMLKAGIDEITEDMQARITINLMTVQGARSQALTLMEKYGLEEVPVLTPLEKNLANLARDAAGEKTAVIASIYEKRENLIFPEVKDYFPIKYVDEDINMPVPDMIMQDRHRTRQVEQGFTASRVPGVQKMPRVDFLAIAEESMAAQEWYVGMQPVLDKHAALIRTPEYKSAAGEIAVRWWKDQLDIVARRGWSATAKGNPLLRMARLNINQAILGYKLTTVVMQPFAVFDAIAYATSRWGVGAGRDILIGFGGAWINPKAAMAYVKANPALNLRQAGEIAIEETMESVKGKTGAYTTFKKYAMSGIRATDIMTAAGVQKGFLKILEKNGLTGTEAEAEAEFLMNLTNGSSEVTVRPHVLARGEGARLWLTFQSFFLNRWGILTHDLIKTGYNANWSRKGTALLGLMIMVAGGLAEDKARELLGLLMGGKEDEEGFWKKVFLYMPRQLPAIGGLFEKWGKAEPPAVQTLGKGAKGIMQIGAGKPIAGLENLAESIATLGFGVPGTVQGFDILDKLVLDDVKKEEAKPDEYWPRK